MATINYNEPASGTAIDFGAGTVSDATQRVVLVSDVNVPVQGGAVSSVNSTTTPLSAGATWTGTWEECYQYASISILGVADVAGTLYADFSIDGISSDRAVQLSSGSTADFGIHCLVPVAKYFRVRVVNGGSNQASLRVQTLLNAISRVATPTSRMTQALGDYTDVVNVRAALAGATPGGNFYASVGIDGEGHLETVIRNPRAAFGEILTATPFPVAQLDFIYGLNADTATTAVTGSGQVTAANGILSVATTAASSSTAQLMSRRYLKYRSGEGAMGRFTAIFTTGAADSKQYAGLGTNTTLNGAFFGYNGTSFGVCRVSGGSEYWTPQASWNQDKCNGAGGTNNRSGINLTPTYGNVYSIKYQYLGFGNIYYYVMNPTDGQFVLVHMEQYANANTAVNIRQPSLNLMWRAVNTTNDSNIVVKGASGALFVEGVREFLGPTHGVDHNKSSITTSTNIVTLKNCTTFNGVTNRAQVHLRTVSFGANTGGAGSGIATLRIVRNATLDGTPVYTTIGGTTADNGVTITSGTSVISRDTAGTTLSGGTVEYNAVVAVGNSAVVDLSHLNLFLNPGDTLTLAVGSTQSATVGVGVSWTEDL